jgi:hypothetical protein
MSGGELIASIASGATTNAIIEAAGRAVVSFAINQGVQLITDQVTKSFVDHTPEKSQPNALLEVSSQNSSYGLACPKVFGKAIIAGNVFWQSKGIKYYSTAAPVSENGKNHSAIFADVGRYYLKDLAIGLGQLPVKKILKIWADDVLVYDSDSDYKSVLSGGAIDTAGAHVLGGFTLYDGTQTAPDPIMEAQEGAGNVPAYSDESYVLLIDYAVAKFENKSGVYYPQPTVLLTPSFKFEVDCYASSLHWYTSTRQSLGYSSTYFKVAQSAPIYEPLIRSPFRLTAIKNDVTTWVDGQSINSYAGIVSNMNALAAAHSEVITEVIGTSFTGLDIVCSRIFDDGKRRIIGFSQAIHGDERDCSWSVEKMVELLITSTDPVYTYVRENFAVYIVATMNPDGMASPAISAHGGTGTRNNGNNVNLNRNWPYYWDTVLDSDKGASAASEPETQAVMNWLLFHNPKRIKLWVDLHGQNTRNDFALFTEQIYHDYTVQFTQRACYNYTQALMASRTYIPGITFAAGGLGRPKLVESRSRRKPYIYTWIQQQAAGNCYGCIIEYPQIESVGLVNTAMTDILKGFMAGACDAIQGELSGNVSDADIGGNAILKPCRPLNSNGLFDLWNSTEKRPSYFNVNGLRLSAFLDGTYRTRRFIRSFRPDDVGWPVQVAGAGYCVINDGLASDQFLICAGYNSIGELPTLSGENLDTGAKTTNQALPTALRDGSMCYRSGYVYFAGGYDLNLATYSNKLYRVPSIPNGNGDVSGWTQVSTMPIALQRHTVTPWGGYLVVTGGRDTTAYQTAVRLYNVASGVWSVLANLTTARGWHTAAVYNNTLFVFGGWTGASTLSSVEKVNLNTGAVTSGTNLVNSRAEQCIAVDPNNLNLAYLCCGRTGSSTVQNDIYLYDMATDTVSNISYTTQQPDSAGTDTTAPVIPDPFVRSAMAFYHPTDDYIGIVGGVDQAGAVGFRFWQLDVPNRDMYLRTTDAPTWGYLRSTQTFTGTTGDKFSLNVALRNADDPIAKPNSNPYARLTIIIGPISSPLRKVRSGYFVPPQNDFRTYTLPFELLAGETEFRIYVRHYGGGTTMDIGGMQVVDTLTSGYIVPDEGGGGGSLDVTFRTPVNPAVYALDGKYLMTRSASGTFSCIFGSQENIDQQVFAFKIGPNSYITMLEVWYTATQDFSAGTVIDPAFPDLVAYNPTGHLYLKYKVQGGATQTATIFAEGTFELNHARLSREYRLDLIDWEVASNGLESWIRFSYYGKTTRVDLSPRSGHVIYDIYNHSASYSGVDIGSSHVDGDPPHLVYATLNGGVQAAINYIYDITVSYISNLGTPYRVVYKSQSTRVLAAMGWGVNLTGITCQNSGVVMSVSRSLATVVGKICEMAGLSSGEYDTTALNGNLIGYPIGQLITGRSMLDPLRAAFPFDVVESGGKLKFKSRSAVVTPLVIDPADLIPYKNGNVLKIGSRQEAEMPNKVYVDYIDPAIRYQQNTQESRRSGGAINTTDSAISLPLVINADTARQIAETIHAASWSSRLAFEFVTTFKWLQLEPSDVISIQNGSFVHTMLITGKEISPSGKITYQAEQHSIGAYSSNATGIAGNPDTQTIDVKAPTYFKMLDLPIFGEGDNDAGFYAAMWNNPTDTGTWNGATLLKSPDNTVYEVVGSVGLSATAGVCSTTLGDPVNINMFDYKNTVDVALINGAFISVTHDDLIKGSNVIAIGNEVLQFTTSTFISGSTYRLSGLLRGRFGTVATGHTASESAILISNATTPESGITRIKSASGEIGRTLDYRALTSGQTLDSAATIAAINTGNGLRPRSVVHIRGSRNTGADLAITWLRRTRFNGQWRDYVDIPLNETTEAYTIKIMSGSTVKRSVTVTTPSFTYTSAMQVADFGSNQSSVLVNIYQLSEVVGPGYVAIGTI